jgi:hypothetical protein
LKNHYSFGKKTNHPMSPSFWQHDDAWDSHQKNGQH